MSTTYIDVVNDVLAEMNEVLLTSSNFDNAVNVQRSVKEMVNRAYFDINNPTNKWPWLSVASAQDNFYGNTYIETTAGERWYLLNNASTGVNDDYGHIDWDNFSITTEGVAGESAPYTVRNLSYTEIEEWKDHWSVSEERNKHDSTSYTTPYRVMRSPDGRRFGLSPIPDKVYRVYFWAYVRPTKLILSTDPIVMPDQYVSVLIARTRYYAWQRKENYQQAGIAEQEYKEGLNNMRKQELHPAPNKITDNRIRFV